MDGNLIIYLSIALFLFAVGAGVFFYGTYKRKRYELIALDYIVGEFWPETGGERYKVLLKKEASGKEAKSPADGKHRIKSYNFDRGSTSQTKYPFAPPLNIPLLAFMQVSIPMVSWLENNPEPINPYKHKPVATAALIAAIQDEDFAAFAMEANKEIGRLQEELIKALTTKVNKLIIYVALGLIGLGVAAIIVLNFYYLYEG